MQRQSLRKITLGLGMALLLIAAVFAVQQVWARSAAAPSEQTSPLHPTFAMLDAAGENVLTSGQPVSTMKTCGECHEDIHQAHAKDIHFRVPCEDCHGPGQAHVKYHKDEDPPVSKAQATMPRARAHQGSTP